METWQPKMISWPHDEFPRTVFGNSTDLVFPAYVFQAGKFSLVPTVINIVAALTSIGMVWTSKLRLKWVFHLFVCYFWLIFSCWQGTVLCDIILLNCLNGADRYKAKKFEEVLYHNGLFFIFHFSVPARPCSRSRQV